jgi:hypothetical protein
VNNATLTLLDPSGAVSLAPNDPSITFLDGTLLSPPLPGGIFLTPTIPSPRDGQWKLRLEFPQANEKTVILVTLFTETRYQAGIVLDRNEYRVGQTVSLGMIVLDNNQPIQGLSPTLTIIPPTGAATSFTGRDNGDPTNLDGLANDGIYSGSYTFSKLGTYTISGQVTIPTSSGVVERTATSTVTVTEAVATLTGVQGTIVRGAGNCVTRLDVTANAEVTQPATYVASATLLGSNNKSLEKSASLDVSTTGLAVFNLSFTSAEIRSAIGVSGPYTVSPLDLLSFLDEGVFLEVRQLNATSFPAIRLSEFCTDPIEIAQNLTVVPTLRDGYIGSLQFSFPVTVASNGTYQISLKVTGSAGQDVNQFGFNKFLSAGLNTVSVTTTSDRFQTIDGPYSVESVLILGQGASAQASVVGNSNALSRWQFFPWITGDLDADGDVDAVDRDLLLTFRSQKTLNPGDRRDLNRDGVIDIRDARAIVNRVCALGSCPLN